MTPAIITQLQQLRDTNKFNAEAWKLRGLHPSDAPVINAMTQLTNCCLDELLTEANAAASPERMRAILERGLSRFSSADFDTEERDFIGDTFFEIATMVDIDLNDTLDRWMYGDAIANVLPQKSAPVDAGEKRTTPCTGCNTVLSLRINAKKEGVPDYWIVVQCNRCAEYNMITCGQNIGGFTLENVKMVEPLRGSKYSHKQAIARFNEIKSQRGKK